MKAENIKLVRELCSDGEYLKEKIQMILQPGTKINLSFACDGFGNLSMYNDNIPKPVKIYIKRQIVIDYEKQILEIDKKLESL